MIRPVRSRRDTTFTPFENFPVLAFRCVDALAAAVFAVVPRSAKRPDAALAVVFSVFLAMDHLFG
ncbi:hypothetical protein [Actibacterium sp. 188UL27-1]|uniref:hypothetical protein n=1 Tax=Actibacterium sp. 188UL27-1 TaxID=2786961 RepID=UPI001956674A|nr:hypothetical protein [Actibacterium sp. 188UL27-1]MBM7070210.1 hypothetical protein [Actibacterium sp. 188UL27-1]